MATRNMQRWAVACITAVLLHGGAYAKEAIEQNAGCAVLEELVVAELTGAAWPGSVQRLSTVPHPAYPSVAWCGETTETVSKAFSTAMATIGVDVRWDNPKDYRGGACLNGFLPQCYPDRYPFDTYSGLPDGPGVSDSWAAVSSIVMQAMPNGMATDHSLFGREAMQLALRAALRNARKK